MVLVVINQVLVMDALIGMENKNATRSVRTTGLQIIVLIRVMELLVILLIVLLVRVLLVHVALYEMVNVMS